MRICVGGLYLETDNIAYAQIRDQQVYDAGGKASRTEAFLAIKMKLGEAGGDFINTTGQDALDVFEALKGLAPSVMTAEG